MITFPSNMLSSLGNVFTAMTGSVAPGTALSTAPPLALHNPLTSQFDLIILELVYGFVSGTIGAGHLQFAYAAQPAAPTGGAALTARPVEIGRVLTSTGKAYQGSTIATPTALRPALQLGSSANSAISECVNPAIKILPGRVLSVEGVAAAGTTPLIVLAITWLEIPVR